MATRATISDVTVETVARALDLTVLAPDHTLHDVEQACRAAVEHGLRAVCLAPYAVSYASRLLRGTGVAICAAVGMPLGHSGLRAKCDEASGSIEAGAGEIDMVINMIAMKSARYGDVEAEVAAVRRLASGLVLKVTLECCYLTDAEKARAGKLALDAGADVLKTHTGFGRPGTLIRDVHLLSRLAGHRAEVEAAGQIDRFKQFQDLAAAGASRIATPAAVDLIKDFYRWESQ